ncbi:GroES family chaperonin [Dolosicoccus paucivorans]|uniref:10 kDa chaperonin n=1 Tax=Dolosicoccus paucivorans TaxID=84521 RepID=A0A1G8P881_9LACT|nr:co-chaperone GroES [Dolosicoccus paucivorans]PMB83562.1 co-chaperone GroES [Dolosicoccus paucivorans]PMC56316.1 co-chaperone GroES [Dolosicoccus paucivorans]SDI88518.1 chaperonin GroES [Dolosicoccus paucivorans]
MLKPLGKRIAVELTEVEKETTTAGGLVLPSSQKNKEQTGVVRALSRKVEEKGEINVGDTVLLSEFGGTKVDYEGQEYVIVSLDNVLAVL